MFDPRELMSLAIRFALLAMISLFLFFGLQQAAHSAERKMIAIVDTGIDPRSDYLLCPGYSKDLTGHGLADHFGHGSLMMHILAPHINLRKECIVMVKYCDESPCVVPLLINAINYVDTLPVDYVNLSVSGPGGDQLEAFAIQALLARGVRVFVAAGNAHKDLSQRCDMFPACYGFNSPNWYVVGALYPWGVRVESSDYNGPVRAWCQGDATSQATIECLGRLLEREDR